MQDAMILTPVIMVIIGLIALILPKKISKTLPLLTSLAIAALFGTATAFEGGIVYNWFGNVNLILELSTLRLIFFGMLWFTLLIYGIATLSRDKGEEAFTLITAGGMAGVLFAGDLLSLFIAWEVMTWASYFPLLERGQDKKAARRYLVFSLAGAASILTGVLLLANYAGTFELAAIKGQTFALVGAPFLAIGFLLKSAVMPFHRWVPSTYTEASDLFTGFLSGALSKVGIYGLILIVILIPFSPKFIMLLAAWLGTLTSLFATFRAIRTDDIKELLAWSSVAQVGYIVTAVALGTSLGIAGAVFHAINHTIIKVLLFTIIAGIIARTGKTKFSEMGALIAKMPFSFIAVLMGIIALAGMPPLSGFASKWLIYSALLESGQVLQLVVVIAASTTAFLYNYKLIYGIFLGQPTHVDVASTKEIAWGYRIAAVPSLILLMVLGMFPSLVIEMVNPVLVSMGLSEMVVASTTTLTTAMGSYNGLVIMNTFGIAFAVILILFTLLTRHNKSRNLHHLDIAYAAETPTEKTPLHYGWGIGRELHRVPFIGYWLQKSTKYIYKYIHSLMNQGATLVRIIYNGNIGLQIGISFLALIVLWFISGGKS